jgi:hypothetical protein
VLAPDHRIDREVSMNKSSSFAFLLRAVKRGKAVVSTEQATPRRRIIPSLGDSAKKARGRPRGRCQS